MVKEVKGVGFVCKFPLISAVLLYLMIFKESACFSESHVFIYY